MSTGRKGESLGLSHALANSYAKAASSPQGWRLKLTTFASSMEEEAKRKGCRPCQRLWRIPRPTRW